MQDPCISNSSLIKAVFPCHALKRVARLFALPIDTARAWIYRDQVPQKKLTKFYQLLLEENERELARRQEIRRQLEALTNARMFETSRGDSRPVDARRLAQDIARNG